MMKKFTWLSLGLILAAAAPSAHASHGQNFLLLEDYDIPDPGHGQILGAFDWERFDGEDFYSSEPSVLFGFFPQLAFSLSAHFAEGTGSDWDYTSITPRFHVRLTPHGSKLPFRAGFSFGYQFANGNAEEEGSHAAESGHAEEEEHAEEAGHHEAGHSEKHGGVIHAPVGEEVGHHSFIGIDDHDSNLWHTRLLLETDITENTLAVFNLIGVFPEKGSARWGYGVGVRQQLAQSLAVGLEARGDFEAKGQHELLVGSYWSPIHDFTVRVGCGFGLTEASPDFALHTGVIWRF